MANGIQPQGSVQRSDRKPTTTAFSLSDEMLEGIRVREVWEILRRKPRSEQRDLVRNHLRFTTPALFHLLREKSVPEGREDRKYGVHLAELAIEGLHVLERTRRRPLLDLRAQGWAWVGNARRLAFDFDSAEQAFAVAEDYLLGVNEDSLVAAETFGLKAALRQWQRRFDEALDLHRRSLPIFRSLGGPGQIAKALIQRANIHVQLADFDTSIPGYLEALQFIDENEEPYLKCCVTYNLAAVSVSSGAYQRATELLPEIRRLSKVAGRVEEISRHLLWLEGSIQRGLGEIRLAKKRLLEARRDFLRESESGYAALVSLDLAVLELEADRFSEVLPIISEVVPVFESLRSHQEVAAVLRLLRDATTRNKLSIVTLQRVRAHLETFRLAPLAHFPPPAE